MKKRFICLAMCLLSAASTVPAFAAKFSFGIPKDLNVSDTYTNGEHAMIPLRSTAEALGYNVVWNGTEKSIAVSNENTAIEISLGADSYYVEALNGVGMSNPVMVGAAPELKDGKTYVPAVMIAMLRFYDSLSAAEMPTE